MGGIHLLMNKAREYLKQYFGYESFRHGQEAIIERVLSGNNTAGIMPTGGGKSICYQIPALLFPGVTLVISPLISLMKDQVDALIQNGIDATFLNSTLTATEARERMNEIKQGKYKLVYVAPERLDHSAFQQEWKNIQLSLVAIDEAHCISQWGHDFRPSYLKIKTLLNDLPSKPIVLALTATATPQVTADICTTLGIDENTAISTGFARDNLYFSVVKEENRDQYLMRYVEKNKQESGIIYAATRKDVDLVYKKLKKAGIQAGRYHAGMSDQERNLMQEQFLHDELLVMVATSAFGMGIDKSNVRYVIHYQTPKNMESYYQEAGRAGRDGLESECILLYSPQDLQVQRFLIDQSLSNPDRREEEIKKLNKMKDYSFTEGCLQAFILEYFGEVQPAACGHCENCTDQREEIDVTVEAQMVLSCMIRMGQRFGKTLISQVLTGSQNRKMDEFGFRSLSTYGIIKNQSAKEVADFIDFLTSKQYIEMTGGQYPVLKVTNSGKAVLMNQTKVYRKERKVIENHSVNQDLFEQLRQCRKELAKSENVAPFIIFSDVTLKDMATSLPITTEQFLRIKGVGQQKFERYGKVFMNVIAAYLDDHPEIIQSSIQQIKEKKRRTGDPTHLETYHYYQDGKSIKEISALRELSIPTIENHLIKCVEEGHELNWDEIFTKNENIIILDTANKLGEDKLKPIKEALPDNITYFMIKAALARTEG